MAYSSDLSNAKVPFSEQDYRANSELIEALQACTGGKKKHGVGIKKSTYKVDNSQNHLTVDSWRFMSDFDYKKPHVPTQARGLFTARNSAGQHEIVARGYNKFFNVNEVTDTRWENIKEQTLGPYELTLKENGCIIFVSGLEDGTLLICSKHSTGARADVEQSHAVAGERSLDKQLALLGRNKEDLARELRERNVTLIAELCDDTFEEHILEYPPEKAGLYLHGINVNIPQFTTYPSPMVQDFARKWNFKEIGVIMMDDIEKVKEFLHKAAVDGSWDGRAVEGFVIRCRMSYEPGKLPYFDWFFKFKFEEPYLMYRQWRECTKDLIRGKAPRFKKHVRITEEYLLYAKKRLAQDRNLGPAYMKNHGIIQLRDDFLEYKNIKGSDAANLEQLTDDPTAHPEVTGNIMLVPIATIGCGKTTIASALTYLFGWGHVQNDNISGKGRPPRFTKACLDILNEQPVVIADRNNAQRHERKQLITDVRVQRDNVMMVVLNFVHESMDEVRKVTQERVLARGDNHQTIHAGTDQEKFLGVMEGFISRFEPYSAFQRPDDGFDTVINLSPIMDSRQNLETVVSELHRLFPQVVKEMPTSEQLDEATAFALEYRPDFKHTIPSRGGDNSKNKGAQQKASTASKKKKTLEYMSIDVPKSQITAALEKAFRGKPPSVSKFFTQLDKLGRIQPAFHVTLMHRAMSKDKPELWEKYSFLHEQATAKDDNGKLGVCDVLLERVVFDDRIMAIVVRIAEKESGGGPWECANQVAHITVGTRDNSVKPKESNDLLARWLEDGTSEGSGIQQIAFEDQLAVSGVVKGVLARF